MNNYVISLPYATKRREHIQNEFSKHNLTFEFFDAIRPSEELDKLIEENIPSLKNANLTDGEKACFMSHFILWKKCIEEDLPYIAIFEDDIFLGKESNIFLSNYDWVLNVLENDNFLLKLETFLQPSKLGNTVNSFKNRKINALLNPHYGTAGYIISKSKIEEFISEFKNLCDSSIKPIDVLMFEESLELYNNVFQLCPAICVQELRLNKKRSKFTTTIPKAGIYDDNKVKRTIIQNLLRVFFKPVRMFKKYQQKKHIIPFE
ncbi:glycosyltransferase family 25 protein [Ursidibacter sp. B-7004-1]